jgi:hypothetical protein
VTPLPPAVDRSHHSRIGARRVRCHGARFQHAKAAEARRQVSRPFLLSPFVLAELDYLLATRVGVGAQRVLLDEVATGAYGLGSFTAEDVAAACGDASIGCQGL